MQLAVEYWSIDIVYKETKQDVKFEKFQSTLARHQRIKRSNAHSE